MRPQLLQTPSSKYRQILKEIGDGVGIPINVRLKSHESLEFG